MSLTSFVNKSSVRRELRLAIPKPKFRCDLPLLAPSLTEHRGLVGTAFDYLLRFYVERLNPGAKKRQWIAEDGFALLSGAVSKRSRFYKLAEKAYLQAKQSYLTYLQDGKLTDDLLIGTIQLAHLDTIFRTGFEYITQDHFKDIDDFDLLDLKILIRLVKAVDFKSRAGICLLNPTFGSASGLVGGADADIIIDDRLIDIKTTENLELPRKHFNQLLGYYVLLTLQGGSNYEEMNEIKYLCVYFSRYGYLHQMPIIDFVNSEAFPSVVKQFVEMACPSERVRMSYYKDFSWPPCQEWLSELQEKRRHRQITRSSKQKTK